MKHIIRNVASVITIVALMTFMSASSPKPQNMAERNTTTPISVQTQEVWLESLLTDTPQEGRELAVKLARRSIATIQTSPEIRKQLRSDYDTDTEQLIMSAQVIAIEFQTIAAANNYWRD